MESYSANVNLSGADSCEHKGYSRVDFKKQDTVSWKIEFPIDNKNPEAWAP